MKTLLLTLILGISLTASTLVEKSTVKVYTSIAISDYTQPWQTPTRSQFSGSGIIIKDEYIITNAHVVSGSKFTQVSKENSSKRYTASVEYISHQADLALLKVKNKNFYNDTTPLVFTEDISTGDNVTVLGFPLGGSNLSTTKGVISRIESCRYVWSAEYLPCIQIDAAINSGNSGGAAIDNNDNIIGIVMQSYSKRSADNIGYIIPSVIVKTFLEDIKDGIVDGYENSNTRISEISNPVLKEYYDISDKYGILINSIQKGEDAFKVGDIVLEVEGVKVFNDGKINTKYGLQNVNYLEYLKPVGQTINIKVKRDGKIKDIVYTLKRKKEVIKFEREQEPRYIIFGGLVFSPLTQNYLNKKKYSKSLFEVYYEFNDKAKHAKEAVIVQGEKFDHNINEGYKPYNYLIHSVNGAKVIDFKHFVKLIDESKNKYTIIDFIDLKGTKYVFKTKETKESFEEIKNIYGLSTDRRM